MAQDHVTRAQRDARIIRARRHGWTYQRIADHYNVSRQRAWQIVTKAGKAWTREREPWFAARGEGLNVYLAARYSRRVELVGYADQLLESGLHVTSRWLEGNHQAENDQLHRGAEAERFAAEDLDDLRAADVLIAFSEAPRTTSSRGGRHVEFGYAFALGTPILLVGPREHVFCCLVDQVDEWSEAWPWISRKAWLHNLAVEPVGAANSHPQP